MKRMTYPVLGILLLCLFAVNTQAQELVKDVQISSTEATLQMADQSPQSYFLEIGGPNNYYWKEEINDVKSINLSNIDADGEKFADGIYKLQVTPILKLSPEQKTELQEIRNDEKALAAYRIANNLPAQVNVYNVNFSIRNGKFVSPGQKEARLAIPSITSSWAQNHPSLYASLNPVEMDYGKPVLTSDNRSYATDNSFADEEAQVFTQDVVVKGSLCVGIDCASGESFGFDTQRLKENNLRIHFNDTSNSASFPGNDWRISINSSDNGGSNYFAIDDVDGGKTPFRIEAGAPTNTLYVESDGDVGIKTANPVVDLHIVEGNTPTTRLEQDGSDGFTPQAWDIAGNEANFFIRDVTNGSKLVFRIKPGAPEDAIFIAANGDTGLGTDNPASSLHLRRTNGATNFLIEEASSTSANRLMLSLKNNGGARMTFENTSAVSQFKMGIVNSGNFTITKDGVTGSAMAIDADHNVGIKTNSPDFDFEVEGTAGKTGGGVWETPSDRRLKTNIEKYSDGLDQLLKIRPVRYEFNGKNGFVTGKKFVGIIAQEMQEIAPYMVKESILTDESGVESNYLTYDGSALTYMLVNAVQEQNEKIEQQEKEIKDLQNQLSKLDQLQREVAQLAELVKQNAANAPSGSSDK